MLQVVDMFGCGLPACAVAYSCIGELVQHGTNGLLFTSAEDLAHHWSTLLRGFPAAAELEQLRSGISGGTRVSWEDAWLSIVRPIVIGLGAEPQPK